MTKPDPSSARRIELILQQVEQLPTLPAVAMRLLQVTSSDDSDAQDVIDLVKSDPALTAKILSLCRSAATGVRASTMTVDRAVVLLGFEQIRNAVLSIKVFETFAEEERAREAERPGEAERAADDEPESLIRFQRADFWRHCLGVAIAAELIAAHHSELADMRPAEAFVCGLMHDVGKLALEHVLPKSYQRVIELTEQTQTDIAAVERKVIGMDHHTAGKRLAERWGLAHALQDVIWLHGAPIRSLPEVKHRRLIGLVGLADLVVRRQHLGYSGNFKLNESVEARAEALGLEMSRVNRAVEQLHEQIERRAGALGLGRTPSQKLFLESIMQANTVLGRLNNQLETQRRTMVGQNKLLAAIRQFHTSHQTATRGVQDVLASVIQSAGNVLGSAHYGLIYQPSGQTNWQISQFNADSRVIRSQITEPPPGFERLSDLQRSSELPVEWAGLLPWLTDYLVGYDDLRKLRLLPLPCAWGTAAVLIHNRPELPERETLEALTSTWGAAIGAATQHDGARRLAEQLAETNRTLTETQDALLRQESLARLGEMTAGAAHEMNNPLAIISGRAQLLAMRLERESREQRDAALISEKAQELSAMITALHLFAEPPEPDFQSAPVEQIMERAIELVRQRMPEAPAVKFSPSPALPPIHADPEHLAAVLAELILNAHQATADAESQTPVRVHAQLDPLEGRMLIQVIDEGVGMDAETAEHAFDPFFSARQAGRRPGLGLARASRLIEAMGGGIDLQSTPGTGTTATVRLAAATSDTSLNPDDHQSMAAAMADDLPDTES